MPTAGPAKDRSSLDSSLPPPFDRSYSLINSPVFEIKNCTPQSSLVSFPQPDNFDRLQVHLNLSTICVGMWSQNGRKLPRKVTSGFLQARSIQARDMTFFWGELWRQQKTAQPHPLAVSGKFIPLSGHAPNYHTPFRGR
jgi:hypothetical protein